MDVASDPHFFQLHEILAYWHGGHTVPRAARLRTGTIGANANYHRVTELPASMKFVDPETVDCF